MTTAPPRPAAARHLPPLLQRTALRRLLSPLVTCLHGIHKPLRRLPLRPSRTVELSSVHVEVADVVLLNSLALLRPLCCATPNPAMAATTLLGHGRLQTTDASKSIGGVERAWPPAPPMSHWRNGEGRAPRVPGAMLVAAPPPCELVSWPAWEQEHQHAEAAVRDLCCGIGDEEKS